MRTLAALVVVCCGLAGCGGDQESAPIWLTTDGGSLRVATRDVEPRPALVLRALLAGPTPAERNRGLRTDLPASVELVSSSLRGGTVRVELRSDELGRTSRARSCSRFVSPSSSTRSRGYRVSTASASW